MGVTKVVTLWKIIVFLKQQLKIASGIARISTFLTIIPKNGLSKRERVLSSSREDYGLEVLTYIQTIIFFNYLLRRFAIIHAD